MNFDEALDGTYDDWLQYTDERHEAAMDCLYKQWKRENRIIDIVFGTMIVICVVLFLVGVFWR